MPLGCKRIKECQSAPPAASAEYLQRKSRRYGAETHAWGLTHSSSTALSVSVSVSVFSVAVLSMPVLSVVVLSVVTLSVVILSDRKSTRLNSSHVAISYDIFCLR